VSSRMDRDTPNDPQGALVSARHRPAKKEQPAGSSSTIPGLPNNSSSKNFATCIVVDFAAARKRPKQRAAGQRIHPRERAVEWLRQLEAGEVASRAALARREGVSRARVTQVLNQIRDAVAGRQRAG
jgi:hypothetical protein